VDIFLGERLKKAVYCFKNVLPLQFEFRLKIVFDTLSSDSSFDGQWDEKLEM